jgi:hypothetical protein
MGMKISQAIEKLVAAKRHLGDVDLVHVLNDQFADILAIEPMTEPTDNTRWVWDGPAW